MLFRFGLRGLFALRSEPLTYSQDGLFTVHNADFLTEPDFAHAYRLAVEPHQKKFSPAHIEWRTYICCWAASQALRLEGDFVECGVNTGMYSRAIVDYVSFESQPRSFYLLDTFDGFPVSQLSAEEVARGIGKHYVYRDVFALTKQRFEDYPNVVLVRGLVPATLSQVPSNKVAYLSIDMNAVEPEIAAISFFWEKLAPGAIVVLDDYGWKQHIAQKRALDRFAYERGIRISASPPVKALSLSLSRSRGSFRVAVMLLAETNRRTYRYSRRWRSRRRGPSPANRK